jgi:hypothetical protein
VIEHGDLQGKGFNPTPVTYSDKSGTKKFDIVLRDVQTNEKFHYNLFSVTKNVIERVQVGRGQAFTYFV